MKSPKIFLVEDDLSFGSVLKSYLELNDYQVDWVDDGKYAVEHFRKGAFDVCILDVMLPHVDGFTIAGEIRKINNLVPIIFLTAKKLKEDVLKGYGAGGDDYVTKPFSPSVLMARINKIVKREKTDVEELLFGLIRMSLSSREVFIAGKKIELTPKEFELLKYFIDNKGIALSRDKILNAVWNYDYFGDLRTVDTHIKQLRAKLGETSAYISTVRSIGYRLDIEHENID